MVREIDATRDPTILVYKGQLVSISRRCGSIIMLCRTRHPNLGTAVMKNWPREADFRFTGFLFFPRVSTLPQRLLNLSLIVRTFCPEGIMTGLILRVVLCACDLRGIVWRQASPHTSEHLLQIVIRRGLNYVRRLCDATR